jgi:hypothetical protein
VKKDGKKRIIEISNLENEDGMEGYDLMNNMDKGE